MTDFHYEFPSSVITADWSSNRASLASQSCRPTQIQFAGKLAIKRRRWRASIIIQWLSRGVIRSLCAIDTWSSTGGHSERRIRLAVKPRDGAGGSGIRSLGLYIRRARVGGAKWIYNGTNIKQNIPPAAAAAAATRWQSGAIEWWKHSRSLSAKLRFRPRSFFTSTCIRNIQAYETAIHTHQHTMSAMQTLSANKRKHYRRTTQTHLFRQSYPDSIT